MRLTQRAHTSHRLSKSNTQINKSVSKAIASGSDETIEAAQITWKIYFGVGRRDVEEEHIACGAV